MSKTTVNQPTPIVARASLTPAETAEVQALKQLCDAHDGLDLKVSWGDPASATNKVFLARDGGRLTGFASLDGDAPEAEVCGMVAPDARRAGLGTRLFEAARTVFSGSGGEQLFVICEEGSPAGRAFVDTLDAIRAFTEHRMELRADVAPDDGPLTVRQLSPDDDDTLAAAARITAGAFERPFDSTLRHMRADLEFPNQTLYAGLVGADVVGAFKLYDEDATTGIYGFAIDPAHQRQGLGRRMLARACALALARGATRVTLEVDATNTRASALYTSSGFVTITTYGYYLLSRTLLTGGLRATRAAPPATPEADQE